MTRARLADAALAALVTLAVVIPANTLFQSASWFRPAAAMVLAVAVSGVGLRLTVDSTWLVVGGQVVAGWLTAGLLFGRGHLWHGIPGLEAVQAYNVLLSQALRTVQTSSAPAPTTRGIILALGLLIGVTAVAVDALAVTRRSPTLAGLPLLAAYLGAATNSGEGLSAVYFIVPSALWVTMMGRQGVGTMRRWATAVARADEPRDLSEDAVLDFASLGRVLGVGAIVAAVVVTPVIPHLPTTFVAQGLGRSENSRGAGGTGIRLSSTLDISKNLQDRSKNAVLVYQTSSRARPPFLVDVLTDYADGQWQEGPGVAIVFNDQRLPFKGLLRTLAIIPYTIPGFISILIWVGLLNPQFGPINTFLRSTFGVNPQWFNDGTLAKVAIFMINTWLGYPYMLIITLGALQSIPSDLYEAAEIDGASIYQRFRRITLPLLLVAVTPLLIGAFAFNFNNFTLIELVTAGGPAVPNSVTPAGQTDILISYSYRVAFSSGAGNDYAFAATISIFIFVIIASITLINFRLSRRVENLI